MLSVADAQARVLALVPKASKTRVSLTESRGLYLAEDIRVNSPIPRFAHSTMDGYAVAAHTVRAGLALPVVGESRAGSVQSSLHAGSAMRIFTGAPLPAGADAVIMQEEAVRTADTVTFAREIAAGHFVRARGCDLAPGTIALTVGTKIHAPVLSLLAMLDRSSVEVYSQIRVHIAPTGDELRAPGGDAEGTRPHLIPESNGIALSAMTKNAGAHATILPHAGDTREGLAAHFRTALQTCDVLVTIGGVSVGDHDWVPHALQDAGVVVDFAKVAMKPGKPLLVGTTEDRTKVVLGLPGNPASAMVTFALFGLPLLRAMAGCLSPLPAATMADLECGVTHSVGRTEFLRALYNPTTGTIRALDNQQSAAATSMAYANALLEFPSDQPEMSATTRVRAYLYRDLGLDQ